MGGAAELPTQFLDLWRMPRAWRRGHRLICFGHVAVRGMSDGCPDFAEKGFEVAAPTSRLQQSDRGRDFNARWDPAVSKVGEQDRRIVRAIASSPCKPRLLSGHRIDDALQSDS